MKRINYAFPVALFVLFGCVLSQPAIPALPPTPMIAATETPTELPTATPLPPYRTPTSPPPGIGTLVECDNLWRIFILEPPIKEKPTGTALLPFPYLVVKIEAENIGVELMEFSQYYFVLEGRLNGKIVMLDPESATIQFSDRYFGNFGSVLISPNNTGRIAVAFDVDPEISNQYLIFSGSRRVGETEKCTVRISLEQ